ncbi:hypothetical protein GQ457_02G026190 [Hibiscus cannabinus]
MSNESESLAQIRKSASLNCFALERVIGPCGRTYGSTIGAGTDVLTSKVNLVFSYYPCPDGEQVQMAVFKFSDYALVWWTQLTKTRNNNGEGRVLSWEELKHIMRRCFIPSHYQRELKQRLQRLRQGSRTIEEYYKEMEALIQRADIQEEKDDTLERFIVGLNDNILDVLDLQNYVNLDEALQIAIAIENQQK